MHEGHSCSRMPVSWRRDVSNSNLHPSRPALGDSVKVVAYIDPSKDEQGFHCRQQRTREAKWTSWTFWVKRLREKR